MAQATPEKKSTPQRKVRLVKQWMSSSVHSVGKDQPLAVAVHLMREHHLRHLPVLEGGKLVGLLSERDLYYLESVAGVDVEKERVDQGMSQDVFCTSPEATLDSVVAEMARQKIGSAVVVQGGKVVGMFTTTDALELLAKLLEEG